MAVYYLTYACDFRCPYCSDGAGSPYYKLKSPSVDSDTVIKILKEIRQNADHLVITGGEPLNYSEVDMVLEALPALKFKTVVFTTNGYSIHNHIDSITKAVNNLVFSVDTLDSEKADSWFGKGHGTLKHILENVKTAKRLKKHSSLITISLVVTGDNIRDAYEVYEYSKSNGFHFAACPQLVGVKVHEDLYENPAYVEFFNYMLSEKRKGYPVFGSPAYLEYMRDLIKFPCRPFTMLVVAPDGGVYYPCLEIGHMAGNILVDRNLDLLKQKAAKIYGPQPDCGNQCQSACALSFGVALKKPLSGFAEAKSIVKGVLLGRR